MENLFVPYPKIPRLKRSVVITEKLDGTNAQVIIVDPEKVDNALPRNFLGSKDGLVMCAGSRTRRIHPNGFLPLVTDNTDNFGFAKWVHENTDELFKLGEGRHYGEWWGQGIQRGYGLDTRRFSLFNSALWGAHNPNTPECCSVVPILNQPIPDDEDTSLDRSVESALHQLRVHGSAAARGYMKPDGIIVYHTASRTNYKVLLENDGLSKTEEASNTLK
jgi:hypothetical protein